MSAVWEQTLRELTGLIAAEEIREFVDPLRPVEERNGSLILEAPNRLAAEIVRQRYLTVIQESLGRASHGSLSGAVLRVRNWMQQELFPKDQPPTAAPSHVTVGNRASTLSPK